MVAEPVQASVQFLRKLYHQTNEFVNDQTDKIASSDYYTQIVNFTSEQTSKLGFSNHVPPPPPSSGSLFNNLIERIQHNKVKYISVLSIGLGITSYLIYHNTSGKHIKRRVPKLPNGARKDVILIMGSPTEPLTRLIALDFEKRGFIVYLTLFDTIDYKYIQSNPITKDLNYISMFDSHSMEDNLTKFQQLFKIPIQPFENTSEHYLELKCVLFAPNFYFPIGPIENINISSWTKMNEKFLQVFKLLSCGLVQLIRKQESKLIYIKPNIISSLKVPYNGPEVLFQNTLSNLFTVLNRELRSQNVQVTQIKLGNLNISNNQYKSSNSRIESLINSEVRSWSSEIKTLYSDTFAKSQFKSNPIQSSGGKGTSLRDLYHLLFDLTYNTKYNWNPSTIFCGKGARSYEILSRILPESIVGWLLS